MNWEAIGAVAEILGAVAVVASLVYLGRQIHQSNAQSQADARYSFLDAYGQLSLTIAANNDLASVFRRGMQGLELDEDEVWPNQNLFIASARLGPGSGACYNGSGHFVPFISVLRSRSVREAGRGRHRDGSAKSELP